MQRRRDDHELVAVGAVHSSRVDDVGCEVAGDDVSRAYRAPTSREVRPRVRPASVRARARSPWRRRAASGPRRDRGERRRGRRDRTREVARARRRRRRNGSKLSRVDNVPSKSNAATDSSTSSSRARDARVIGELAEDRRGGRGAGPTSRSAAAPGTQTVSPPREAGDDRVGDRLGRGRHRRRVQALGHLRCARTRGARPSRARRCRRGCRRGPAGTRPSPPSTSRRRSSSGGRARRRPTTARRCVPWPCGREPLRDRDRDRDRAEVVDRARSRARRRRRARLRSWSPSTPKATSTTSKSPNRSNTSSTNASWVSVAVGVERRRPRPSVAPAADELGARVARARSGRRAGEHDRPGAAAARARRTRRERDVGAAAEDEDGLDVAEGVAHARAFLGVRSEEPEAAGEVGLQHAGRGRRGRGARRQPVELGVHLGERARVAAASPWRGRRGRRRRRRAGRAGRGARRDRAPRPGCRARASTPARGTTADPGLPGPKRFSTARNDARPRVAQHPRATSRTVSVRVVGHHVLVLHEAAAAVEPVPAAHAVERVEEGRDPLELADLERRRPCGTRPR